MATNYNAPAIWGQDILLNEGDFVPSSTGDLSLVSSISNVKQAIVNRLKTEVGSLPYDTTYGLDLSLLIGRKHTLEREEFLRTAIVETLKQEPRIRAISQVQVLSDKNRPDVIYVSIVVIPTSTQTPLVLNLVYPYWTLTLVEKVVNEKQTSLSSNLVDVDSDIYTIEGVWLATDTGHTGTNYYLPNGSFTGKRILLGTKLSTSFADMQVNYTKKVTPQIALQ